MKFYIRDLLWFTVVVALAVAWGVDRFRLKSECHQLNERLNKVEKAWLDMNDHVTEYNRLRDEQLKYGRLLNDSAPAPNLPKP